MVNTWSIPLIYEFRLQKESHLWFHIPKHLKKTPTSRGDTSQQQRIIGAPHRWTSHCLAGLGVSLYPTRWAWCSSRIAEGCEGQRGQSKDRWRFLFFWIGNLEKEEEHFSDDKTYGKTTEILVCYFFLKFVFFMLKPFFWGSTRCILWAAARWNRSQPGRQKKWKAISTRFPRSVRGWGPQAGDERAVSQYRGAVWTDWKKTMANWYTNIYAFWEHDLALVQFAKLSSHLCTVIYYQCLVSLFPFSDGCQRFLIERRWRWHVSCIILQYTNAKMAYNTDKF